MQLAQHRKLPCCVGEVLWLEVAHAALCFLASAVSSCASSWPCVANAHAALASFCGLKLPTQRSASCNNNNNNNKAWRKQKELLPSSWLQTQAERGLALGSPCLRCACSHYYYDYYYTKKNKNGKGK